MSNPIGTYTTGSNGKVTAEKIRPGTVYIQETSVPVHLILDSNVKVQQSSLLKLTSIKLQITWKTR